MTSDTPKSHGRLKQRPTLRPRELMTDSFDLAGIWTARIITLFPETFPGVLGASLTGKALQDKLWQLQTINLREFGVGKHRNVDDTPAGGGAGLVMRPDVLGAALDEAKLGAPSRGLWPVLYMSPRGRPMDQALMQRLARGAGVTILCGRFEGVDERVIEEYDIEEVSLGDFVLTGGEIAAQALLDATVRLLPGVLGNAESIEEESFSSGILEHPQYTRPAEWRGRQIPPVLLSGNHGAVEEWRRERAEQLTKDRRPDLWGRYSKKSDNT